MASTVFRTVIIYFLLSFSMKIMGKRQLGELETGEIISTLLISEIAAMPIDDPDLPLLNAVLPILLIVSVEILFSSLKNRSEPLERLFEGEPEYIIYKGKIREEVLRENRITMAEVLAEVRQSGIGDLSEVRYGILEQNGKLSLIKNEDADRYPHVLVIDGAVQKKNLAALGYTEEWLEKKMPRGAKNTLLLTVDDGGRVRLVERGSEGNGGK